METKTKNMNNEQTKDLRERAEELLTEAANRDYQNEAQAKDAAINLLLQFAAEVAGEKDREISELGKKLKDQNSMIADLWETIDESNQRIAELETVIKKYQTPDTYPDPRNYMDD